MHGYVEGVRVVPAVRTVRISRNLSYADTSREAYVLPPFTREWIGTVGIS